MYYADIFFFCLLYYVGNANLSTPPEVITPLGKVQGEWKISYEGRQYASFLGIPYAKPPIENLRFKEPQPVEPWIGIWNATQAYTCPQYPLGLKHEAIGDEDCLYINVFIPTTDQQKLDVVVHIHGGGYFSGSGLAHLHPKYVMDRDIALVTFNYRLGALGFLSTEDELVPGNNGLKDQVLALKWVQENIASFGGDPNSVTLTGFSAGAGSVHLHYFSQLSKGLFHRGWSFSGVATSHWAISEAISKRTKKLATVVGCPTSKSRDLVECLKTRPARLLLEKTKYVRDSPVNIAFGPMVEKAAQKPFLSEHPYTLLTKKEVLDVPWITSVVRNEALFIVQLVLKIHKEINEKWIDIAPYILFAQQLIGKNDILNKIRKFYFGEEPIGFNTIDKLEKMITDKLFKVSAETSAKLQARNTKSPVYFYLFNYGEGQNGFLDLFMPDQRSPGVSHGDDMIYFFGGHITKNLSESDTRLKNACLDMLYSYAKNGVPSFQGVDWLPISGNDLTFLNITSPDDIKMETTQDLTNTGVFWEELNVLENKFKDEL
ncbi:hypothetical protein NQ318_021493 [Aromia moschata]|uniref:Carboxylic ester hydrolase n=1 Tax=Aromia moschata TaxID=1265417 RepID=A0AAV8ZER8_9CUCU|nr:hypothetical protein NQ318_021493 [Aromia moschata]